MSTEPVDLRKETECTCDPAYAHRCPKCGGRGYVRREGERAATQPEQPEEYFLNGGAGFEGDNREGTFLFQRMCDMAASYAEYRVADAESRMENRMKAVPPAAETAPHKPPEKENAISMEAKQVALELVHRIFSVYNAEYIERCLRTDPQSMLALAARLKDVMERRQP